MFISDNPKSKKAIILIGTGLIIAILMLLWGGNSGDRNNVPSNESEISLNNYVKYQEEKLEKLISEIQGVSDPKVMITLRSGNEYVYASDSSEKSEKHVVVDDALVCVKENLPEIEGIAVVCKGGNNDTVKEQITELLCSLFGLYSNHVYVTE